MLLCLLYGLWYESATVCDILLAMKKHKKQSSQDSTTVLIIGIALLPIGTALLASKYAAGSVFLVLSAALVGMALGMIRAEKK